MIFLLFCCLSGTLGQMCNYSGLEDCVLKPSVINFTQKISSPNYYKTRNPQEAVEEQCSIQWELVSCFQDIKRCVPTKNLPLKFDLLISATKYMCAEGKQGFIENFQCVMTNFVWDHNNLQSCQKYYPELINTKNTKLILMFSVKGAEC
ncbi:uncharacterized protein LOC134242368 [Saccostrea cucullata]|uniref:uncharacterized protein LOC134242368 n=1 Tax=Saccostrea cuccullata TaxID=36930 RepID=UPI002ED29D14